MAYRYNLLGSGPALVIYDNDGNDPTLIERLYFEAGIEQGISNAPGPGAGPTSPWTQFFEKLFELFGGEE